MFSDSRECFGRVIHWKQTWLALVGAVVYRTLRTHYYGY
jgi:hypothetical protein